MINWIQGWQEKFVDLLLHVRGGQSIAPYAITQLTRYEGIIPALESAHALAHALELAATRSKDTNIIINLSGRGDKDLDEVVRLLGK